MNTLVLLAAGAGSRLLPLTYEIPKPMLHVGNRPIIDALVSAFGTWPDRVVVITGHRSEALVHHTRSWSTPTVLRHNPLFATTNSLFSLAIARDAWASSDAVAVSNTDVLLTSEAVSTLLRSKHDIALALDRRSVDREDMKLVIDREGYVQRVSKEVDTATADGEFTGLTLARGAGIDALAHVIEASLHDEALVARGWYDLALDTMARSGTRLNAIDLPLDSYVEVDTHEDLERAKAWLARHQGSRL